MGHPSVSCIIPTRDSAASLRGAIESVLCQSVCPAEIIVADAGSTDTSRDVAREFGSWVRLVWCARSTHADADVAAARRLGLRFATCDFITMLDPVARWRPDKLERQLAHLAARPGLDLSITEIGPETRLNGEQSALEHAYTTLLARRVAPAAPEASRRTGDHARANGRARAPNNFISAMLRTWLYHE